jgi:hypothetical protein
VRNGQRIYVSRGRTELMKARTSIQNAISENTLS